jgi:hypothetical protein
LRERADRQSVLIESGFIHPCSVFNKFMVCHFLQDSIENGYVFSRLYSETCHIQKPQCFLCRGLAETNVIPSPEDVCLGCIIKMLKGYENNAEPLPCFPIPIHLDQNMDTFSDFYPFLFHLQNHSCFECNFSIASIPFKCEELCAHCIINMVNRVPPSALAHSPPSDVSSFDFHVILIFVLFSFFFTL